MKDVKLSTFVFFTNGEVSLIHELAKIAKNNDKNKKHTYVTMDNAPDLYSWSYTCSKLREMVRFKIVEELPYDDPVAIKLAGARIRLLVFCINREYIISLSKTLNGTRFIGNDSQERNMVELCSYMVQKNRFLLRYTEAKAIIRQTSVTLGAIEHLGLLRPVTITNTTGKYLEMTNEGIQTAKAWMEVNAILKENDIYATA